MSAENGIGQSSLETEAGVEKSGKLKRGKTMVAPPFATSFFVFFLLLLVQTDLSSEISLLPGGGPGQAFAVRLRVL